MEDFWGTLTMVLALAMVFIAIPSQIIKNHKVKQCGPNFIMVTIPLAIFISRTCYAYCIESWYIFIPDFVGAIASVLLFTQYFVYRKTGNLS